MVSLTCELCNKIFKRKENLLYHLDNKVCITIHNCEYCNKEYKTYRGMKRHILNKHQVTPKSSQIPPNSSQIPPKSSQIPLNSSQMPLNSSQNLSNPHECQYCEKKFTRSDNLKRHEKKSCKVKKQAEEYADKQIESYKNMLLMLKEELKEQSEIIKKQSDTTKAIKQEFDNYKKQNTTISSHNKIMANNNSNNTNNSNSHNTNNINNKVSLTINAYGSENLEYLKTDDYLKCFNQGVDSVLEYLKLKHFNPEHPENHNLYLPNIQQPYYKKFNGMKFIIDSIETLINDVIDNNLMELDSKHEEIKTKII